MRLKKAEVEGCLQVGVVQTDGQIRLLCFLRLEQLLEDTAGVVCTDHLNLVACLFGKGGEHFIGKRSDVVGQNSKNTIGFTTCVEDDAITVANGVQGGEASAQGCSDQEEKDKGNVSHRYHSVFIASMIAWARSTKSIGFGPRM